MTPLLAIDRLTKAFGGVRAVDDLSLEVEAGALICVIGPNGCGKSTLFNLITGAFPPTSGTVRFDGVDITGWPPHRIARLGIGRKFQVPGIYPDLTVAENLDVPLFAPGARRPLPGSAHSDAGDDRAAAVLETVGLTGTARRLAGTLSHGQKQWLEIGMVLAARPRLMLLDEPTAGMTPAETAATADLILRIRRQQGVAVVVIEHDIGFVARLDCPVAVMMKGSLVSRGSYDEVRRDPTVRQGYLGKRA